MKQTLLKIPSNQPYQSVYYSNDVFLVKNEFKKIKNIYIDTASDFIEVMHYARMKLNDLNNCELDIVYKEANGDFQTVFEYLREYLNTIIRYQIIKGFSLNSISLDDNDIENPECPVASGILLFCEENWIFNKVEDFKQAS